MKSLGLLGLALLLIVSSPLVFVGAVAIDTEENGPKIPPDLEALYRQVGRETGVPWVAMAAWDGAANGFSLPIEALESIFQRLVEDERERRRERDRDWCAKHPDDKTRCPPPDSALTVDEEIGIWKGMTQSIWRARRRRYVEDLAEKLVPHVVGLQISPGEVFGRLLGPELGSQAEWLFEGYLVLELLTEDLDSLLIEVPDLPDDWMPVEGFAWPVSGVITSRYGIRHSPIDGLRRLHAGLDLAIPSGTPIMATKAGAVIRAEFDPVYGVVVMIDHQDGYQSLYAHNSGLTVVVGQKVQQGQAIAVSGNTGRSTGPHLHFEIHYKGVPVDPFLLLTKN